jgi:hypothetical protein
MIDERFSKNAACGIPGTQEQYGVRMIHCDPPLKNGRTGAGYLEQSNRRLTFSFY